MRDVLTYNPTIISDIPHYHLSIACNHCQEAPCAEQCPAKAISKDTESGIVIIDENICIGCTYCSWVCPYGAPAFDISEKIMKKCDLCSERINAGYKPACETVCPTGALITEFIDPESIKQEVPFFPRTKFIPAISIGKPGKKAASQQQYINIYPEEVLKQYSLVSENRSVEISLKNEWTLLLFTLLISVMGALFAGDFLAGENIDPVVFGVVGVSGIFFSMIHLGKKMRFFRILRNFFGSWLSREALFFSLFLSSSLLSLLDKFNPVSGITGLISIYFTALSADMIYIRSAAVRKELFHSSQVTITLSLFISIMTGFTEGFALFLIIKIYLYLYRKIKHGFGSPAQVILAFCRLVPGLILPSAIFFITGIWGFVLLLLLFAGEVLDRGEFYYEFDILSPRYVMENFFKLKLSRED